MEKFLADDVETAQNYLKAAEQGDAQAQYQLGLMYSGQGAEQNHAEAVIWFRKAAEQGLAASQYRLGRAYVRGLGVEQNYEEALKWLRIAAEKGDADAQFLLSGMYIKGQGVTKNFGTAYMWIAFSLSQTDPNSSSYTARVVVRDDLSRLMMDPQTAKAQRQAKNREDTRQALMKPDEDKSL
jgi:TPR repeat protein